MGVCISRKRRERERMEREEGINLFSSRETRAEQSSLHVFHFSFSNPRNSDGCT